ncbi:outer membrane protein [Xanthomonas sp. JAI131]|jgi:outer membrane protein|uniref:OmpW/AlkL family protein n=1 Tax=unclassified Xanthomonas TaxID=2643310 RepID=UPI0015C9118F|nr:OmpW family outer membrane protein [Xanthomonas sp. JAI131]NYF20669.1 outer membrane protein [Xanthomonas sp. JAI131]
MMRELGRIWPVYLAVPGIVALAPASAMAAEVLLSAPRQGNWLIRAMALEIVPLNLDSEISYIGGEVDTPSDFVPGLDLSYFVTDHWAIEFQGGLFAREYRISKSSIGAFDVGTVESGAVSLTAQYHFRPHAALNPYIGLGVNYAWEHKVRPAAGIPDFRVDAIASGIANLGFDYRLAGNWYFSSSVRYVISPAYRFEGQGFNATVKVSTLVLGLGVGYRF